MPTKFPAIALPWSALTPQHLAQVLRGRVGQEFDIATGDSVRRGRILSITDDRVEFELGEVIPVAPIPNLTIVLSIFKFDRMEWAIEKCVELGVSRIVPVVAQRTEAHLAKAAEKRVERWQRIALQASEQSRRASAPEICCRRACMRRWPRPPALGSCWLSPKNK